MKHIAIMMIALVLIIPIYISSSYAAISELEAYGRDGLNGFRRTDDYTKVTLVASLDNAPGNDQVVYRDSGDRENNNFMTCSPLGDGVSSQCTYQTEVKHQSSSITFSIILHDEQGNLVEQRNSEIKVDDTGPDPFFAIEEDIIASGEDITVNYAFTDIAYYGTTVGVGIDKIYFYVEGTKFKEISGDESEGSFSIDLVEAGFLSPDYSGVVEITADAIDEFGNRGELLTQSFTIDQDLPEIKQIRLVRKSSLNREYYNFVYVPNNKLHSYLANAKVYGDEIVESSIKANFSALYPESVAQGYGTLEGIQGDCYRIEDHYDCWWGVDDKIFAKLSESKTVPVSFMASDLQGNTRISTILQSIIVDDIPPTLSKVESTFNHDGVNYLGEKTNVTVTFNEDGSMYEGYAWLDFGRFNGGESVRASKCENGWKCEWSDIEVNALDGFEGSIFVVHNTFHDPIHGYVVNGVSDDTLNMADIAGNSHKFKVDKSKPELINYTIKSEGSHNYDLTIQGDRLVIELYVADHSFVEVEADVKDFIEGGAVDGSCEKVGVDAIKRNVIKCEISPTEPINMPANLVARARVNITDITGLSTSFETDPVEISEYTDQELDFWNIGYVSVMPDAVDREITKKIKTEVFVSVPFSGGGEMLELSLFDCKGTNITYNGQRMVSDDLITGYYALNTEKLVNPNPFIVFELKTKDMKTDSIGFKCKFKSVTKSGTKIFPPEWDEVLIEIPFYNNPLGMIDESIADDINESKKALDSNWWKVVGLLEKVHKYASMICNFLQVINTFTAVVHNLKQAAKGELTQSASESLCHTAQNLKESGDKIYKDFGGKMCAFVTCTYYQDGEGTKQGTKLDWGKVVYGHINSVPGISNMNSILGADTQMSKFFNVKDNIILSATSLCLPGLLRNLDKYRQTECMYIDCLENQYPLGVPKSFCEELRGYQHCKYFVGQIFSLIGITAFADWMFKKMASILRDPLALGGAVAGYFCRGMCEENSFTGNWEFCMWWRIIGTISGLIGQLEHYLSNDAWSIGEDYCERVGLGAGISVGDDE